MQLGLNAQFLKEFFQRMNFNHITYCVLKNYEELPERPGRDVDMWVKEEQFQNCLRIMFEVAQDLGWDFLAPSLRLRFINAGEYYFIKNNGEKHVCVLDVSPFLHWRGVSYLDERVMSNHIHTCKKGFKVASPGIEAATLIFRGAMMGVIKNKDKPKITECLERDASSFLEVLERPFGRCWAEKILESARTGNWDFLEQNMPVFHGIICKRAWRRPFFQMRQWVRYFSAVIGARLHPTHGFFIVLLGPDGAGKSTISRHLLESELVNKLFLRRESCYRRFHISWLKKMAHKIKGAGAPSLDAEVKEDGSIVPLGLLKASLYAIYLGMEYFLGNRWLRKVKANTGLVVFDRYFYDYLVFEDFLRIPRSLLRFLSIIVPQPDTVIYLQNDAKTIYARKPEKSVPEIERQGKLYERLVEYLPNSVTINSSKEVDTIISNIENIIIQKMMEREKKAHIPLGFREHRATGIQ
jgi:thymidylate kinase